VFVEWPTQTTTKAWELFATVRDGLAGFKNVAGNALLLSDPFPEAAEIQGRMVGELRNAAIGALILSWALIIFYLRVRFHEYKYGIAAVAALVHDVLVACIGVVIANQFGWVHAEINLNMIACFLTIIGYSVNDTIVAYDRLRENRGKGGQRGRTFAQQMNLAVNQTLSRTILTALTVFFATAILLFLGGKVLEDFAFVLFIGVITGTYSTIYVAAAIVVDWTLYVEGRGRGGKKAVAKA
jgi:SecD/SecF fusion protein